MTIVRFWRSKQKNKKYQSAPKSIKQYIYKLENTKYKNIKEVMVNDRDFDEDDDDDYEYLVELSSQDNRNPVQLWLHL